MKKHIKWLRNEIDLWTNEGIIAPDQGTVLKARYPAPGESLAWGRIIFFSIGPFSLGWELFCCLPTTGKGCTSSPNWRLSLPH